MYLLSKAMPFYNWPLMFKTKLFLLSSVCQAQVWFCVLAPILYFGTGSEHNKIALLSSKSHWIKIFIEKGLIESFCLFCFSAIYNWTQAGNLSLPHGLGLIEKGKWKNRARGRQTCCPLSYITPLCSLSQSATKPFSDSYTGESKMNNCAGEGSFRSLWPWCLLYHLLVVVPITGDWKHH